MNLKIIKNPDEEQYEIATKAVKENYGYCPCALIHSEETKCMCLSFRELQSEGMCECGRYLKVMVGGEQ